MVKYIVKYYLDNNENRMEIYARNKVDALEIFVNLIRKYTERKRNPMILGNEIKIFNI